MDNNIDLKVENETGALSSRAKRKLGSNGLPVKQGLYNPARERDACLLYTSPSPRDQRGSRMPSSA